MGSMRNWLRARGNDDGWPPWNAATVTKFVCRNWRDNDNDRDVGDLILSIEWHTCNLQAESSSVHVFSFIRKYR